MAGYFFLSPVISSRSGVGTGIFQCRGVLLIMMKGHGPIMLMVGSGGVVRLFFFSRLSFLLLLRLSLRRLDIY